MKLAILGVIDLPMREPTELDWLVEKARDLVAEGADGIELTAVPFEPFPHPPGKGWGEGRPVAWHDSDFSSEVRSVAAIVQRAGAPIWIRCGVATLAARLIDAGVAVLVTRGTDEARGVGRAVAGSAGFLLCSPSRGRPRGGSSGYASPEERLTSEIDKVAAAAVSAGVGPDRMLLDPSGGAVTGRVATLAALKHFTSRGFTTTLETKSFSSSYVGKDSQGGAWESEAAVVSLAVAAGVAAVRVRDVRRIGRVARMAEAIVNSVDDDSRSNVGAAE